MRRFLLWVLVCLTYTGALTTIISAIRAQNQLSSGFGMNFEYRVF